jgi:hypothetical protein
MLAFANKLKTDHRRKCRGILKTKSERKLKKFEEFLGSSNISSIRIKVGLKVKMYSYTIRKIQTFQHRNVWRKLTKYNRIVSITASCETNTLSEGYKSNYERYEWLQETVLLSKGYFAKTRDIVVAFFAPNSFPLWWPSTMPVVLQNLVLSNCSSTTVSVNTVWYTTHVQCTHCVLRFAVKAATNFYTLCRHQ